MFSHATPPLTPTPPVPSARRSSATDGGYDQQRSRSWRRSALATLAATIITSSSAILTVTVPTAEAQSAAYSGSSAPALPGSTNTSGGVFGSMADATPPSLVNLGNPMRDPAPYDQETHTSGLTLGAIPSHTGVPMSEVPLDPSVGLSGASSQYRFSYSTTDQHGATVPSTAALFIPQGHMPPGGWPVIAWAHGTVGLADQCAPSINARSSRDAEYLNHWLSQGYAIVASDYAGLGTPGLMSYLNGKTTATSVVDSVIAAQSLPSSTLTNQQLAKKWAVIGQSQGGGAALHVARNATARSEAAGLDFVGTVATGAPAYIEEIVLAAGPTFPPVPLPAGLNTYAAYIMAGFREAHPEIDVNSALTEEGKKWVNAAETSCYSQLAPAVQGMNVARAFSKPLRSVPGLEPALRDYMQTPATGYDKPVFLGHGLRDTDVPTPIGIILNSDMWINQFVGDAQQRNNRVVVRWYPTDHGGTVPASEADSTPFLRDLFRQ